MASGEKGAPGICQGSRNYCKSIAFYCVLEAWLPRVCFSAVFKVSALGEKTLKNLKFYCYFVVVAVACGGGAVTLAAVLQLWR